MLNQSNSDLMMMIYDEIMFILFDVWPERIEICIFFCTMDGPRFRLDGIGHSTHWSFYG